MRKAELYRINQALVEENRQLRALIERTLRPVAEWGEHNYRYTFRCPLCQAWVVVDDPNDVRQLHHKPTCYFAKSHTERIVPSATPRRLRWLARLIRKL